MALATYVAIVLALYTYVVHTYVRTYIRIYVTKTVHTPGIATYVCNNCVEFAIHMYTSCVATYLYEFLFCSFS